MTRHDPLRVIKRIKIVHNFFDSPSHKSSRILEIELHLRVRYTFHTSQYSHNILRHEKIVKDNV